MDNTHKDIWKLIILQRMLQAGIISQFYYDQRVLQILDS